jgi:ankyrin repeat protein
MKKRQLLIFSLLALVLLSTLAVSLFYHREVRQQFLDRALIQAIKKQQDSTAISLLELGADANATDHPATPITFSRLMLNLWDRLSRNTPPLPNDAYPSVLMLVYGDVGLLIPDTSLDVHLAIDGVNPEGLLSWPDANKSTHAPLIAALLKHGVALSTSAKEGNRVLDYACICDDAQSVKVLLEHHVDPNVIGNFGYPALTCTNDYECARLLLKFGANPNLRDTQSRTRLMYVPNTKLYPLLLKYHADPNIQDSDGQTALMRLFLSNYLDDDDIHTGTRFLLQHGAKVSLKDKYGKSALDYAKAGKTFWMYGGIHDGRYNKENRRLLEAALRNEQVEQQRSRADRLRQ